MRGDGGFLNVFLGTYFFFFEFSIDYKVLNLMSISFKELINFKFKIVLNWKIFCKY